LQKLIDQLISEGFAREDSRQYYSVVNSVGRMFDLLEQPADIQVTEHPERI